MEIPGFLKNFRSSVEALRNSLAATEKQLELALRRREELQFLPPPKEEVIEILNEWVRVQADKYPAILRENISKVFRNRDPVTGQPAPGSSSEAPDILTIAGTGRRPHLADLQSTLAFFMKETLCAGIKRAVADMPEWKAGPPQAARVAEIDRLDQEIAELRQKLRAMADSVAETGIQIGLTGTPNAGQDNGRKTVSQFGGYHRSDK